MNSILRIVSMNNFMNSILQNLVSRTILYMPWQIYNCFWVNSAINSILWAVPMNNFVNNTSSNYLWNFNFHAWYSYQSIVGQRLLIDVPILVSVRIQKIKNKIDSYFQHKSIFKWNSDLLRRRTSQERGERM